MMTSDTVIVRTFNARGVERFRQALDSYQAREANVRDVTALATDPSLSGALRQRLSIDVPMLASKRDLAALVCSAFINAGNTQLPIVPTPEYQHMWTWLAARCFHLIKTPSMSRKLNEHAYYVCDNNWNRFYRHRIAGPARLYWLFRSRIEDARILLHGPAHEHSDWEAQLAGRQNRIRHPELIAAANTLYWDGAKQRPKRGAQTRPSNSSRAGGGTLRRLITFIDQVDLTHDVNSMSSDQILDLLPKEFDRWKT